MSIASSAEARFYISNAVVDSTVDTATEYAALTWVEVLEVEDLGSFGDTSSEVTFTSLKDGRVRKFKGSRNAGNMALVCGHDPVDTGQIAMVAAEADNRFEYAFKVTLNNEVTSGGTEEINYFRGRVMSKDKTVGSVDNILRRNFSIAINSAITEVAPT